MKCMILLMSNKLGLPTYLQQVMWYNKHFSGMLIVKYAVGRLRRAVPKSSDPSPTFRTFRC